MVTISSAAGPWPTMVRTFTFFAHQLLTRLAQTLRRLGVEIFFVLWNLEDIVRIGWHPRQGRDNVHQQEFGAEMLGQLTGCTHTRAGRAAKVSRAENSATGQHRAP